jgi:hypothetical protein
MNNLPLLLKFIFFATNNSLTSPKLVVKTIGSKDNFNTLCKEKTWAKTKLTSFQEL